MGKRYIHYASQDGVSITLARMDQCLYNLGLVLCNSTGATGLPRKSSWRWRLESYVRAYGELHTANPVHSRTAAKRRSGVGSENCVGWKLLARYVTVMREGGRGKVGGKRKRLCGQLTGSPICRGLKPATFKLWGKGVSITLARMDQFIYNLGLALCNSTGATIALFFILELVLALFFTLKVSFKH